MKIIVAVDNNWGIGKNNDLLTYIPDDLKYFKEKTLGKVVVMGRKTLESLPGKKPLPGRTNIVLSSNKDCTKDCMVCTSHEELFKQLEKYDSDEIFVIGGQKVYSELLDKCDTYFITKIFKTFDADKFLDNLDKRDDIELIWESDMQRYKDLEYKFTEYRRK